MRQLCLLGLFTSFVVGVALTGCSKKPRPALERPAAEPALPSAGKSAPALPNAGTPAAVTPNPANAGQSAVADNTLDLAIPVSEPNRQDKYASALLDALNLMAERKYTEAPAVLETARSLQDSEQLRREIDKLKSIAEEQKAAEQVAQQTAQDIQTVLKDGKPEDAARLATAGLQQYGPTDEGQRLATLKRQAEALTAAQINDNVEARNRLRREGEAALAERNLRAAAIAFEQALQYGEEAALRKQLGEVSATLARYDENRQRAAELRHDPGNLEDAIAALKEAAAAWDTLQVRQDIDLYTLALQNRRDRISVADFEIRGDVGIPFAGRAIAEELLPAFKPRFDLVERGQLGKVIDELKLEATELAENDNGRREVGRLAKVRYLVLGSVTPLCGITVNARLVDVRSGLVVQTAKIVAASPEQMLRLLPQLASLLMMTDEQKIAYENQLARQTALVIKPAEIVPWPPPPEPPAPSQLVPPAIIVYTPRSPDFGGVCAADLENLPLAGQVGFSTQLVLDRDGPVKRRLLQIAVELGDNLFRRRRYHEAHAQFELALNLSPGHFDLRVRLDRCRAYLPPPPPPPPSPPPVSVVIPPPPLILVAAPPPPRPRVAVFNFVVNCDPALTPPGFGDWAADCMASYYAPTYEVVDRGQLFWYMAQLGLTVRDVATDPCARVWLGRALGVRYFAFGIVQQTASFNVTTHLVDAETGTKQGTGSIHVQDHHELKLRMAELVHQTQTDPAQRDRLQQEAKEHERQLNEAKRLIKERKPAQAMQVCQEALKGQPNNIAMQALLQQAEQQARDVALEEARRRDLAQRQAQAAAQRQHQLDLARYAEATRVRTEKEAATRSDASRGDLRLQHQRAYVQLLAQGKAALQQRNYVQAVQKFESAVTLQPNEDGDRQLAEARALAAGAKQAQAEAEQARREAEAQRQRAAELARVRAQVEAQRRERQAEEQARRKVQEARDQAAYVKLLGEGKQLLAQGKYDAALPALQSARQMHKTEEVERLLSQALDKQAQTAAARQAALSRAELERRLNGEKAKRDEAEARAKRDRELYTQAVQQAQQAMVEKRYAQAVAQYQEAAKFFRTDVVLNGLHQAEEAQAKERAAAEAAKQKQAAERERAAMVHKLLVQGQAALSGGHLDTAAQDFAQAKQLAPENIEVQTWIIRTERAKEEMLAQERRKKDEQQRLAASQAQKARAEAMARQAEVKPKRQTESQPVQNKTPPSAQPQPKAPPITKPNAGVQPKPKPDGYTKQMRAGAAFDQQQKYAEATNAYKEALRLVPGDVQASAALHMATGHKAMKEKRLTDAAREFEAVLRLVPGHPEATKALKQARQGKP